MPRCLEHKQRLSGAVQTFSCELVHWEPGFGVLRYVIGREYDIDGIRLVPGDVTLALYWEDRPYTLYIWRLNGGRNIVHYFNIADRVLLRPEEFRWRDLAVDILIDGNGVRVLDEDELPTGLDPGLSRFIRDAKAHILNRYPDIIREAGGVLEGSALSRRYLQWPIS